MRDIIDDVEAVDVLLLQEVDRVRLAFGEEGDKHVRAGDFMLARRLHMDGGAVDDALEPGGGLGLIKLVDDERGQIVFQKIREAVLDLRDVQAAAAHDRGGVRIVGQRVEQVLQRGVFVAVFLGKRQGAVQTDLKIFREHKRPIPYFSWRLPERSPAAGF